MKVYKLTDPKMCTYGRCQWHIDIPRVTSGERGLCGGGWLHWYTDPKLALFLNSIHGQFEREYLRLFEAEAEGRILHDKPFKGGSTKLTLTREITDFQRPTDEQFIYFGILCAKHVYKDVEWNAWADRWICGDRSMNMSWEAEKVSYVANCAYEYRKDYAAKSAFLAARAALSHFDGRVHIYHASRAADYAVKSYGFRKLSMFMTSLKCANFINLKSIADRALEYDINKL